MTCVCVCVCCSLNSGFAGGTCQREEEVPTRNSVLRTLFAVTLAISALIPAAALAIDDDHWNSHLHMRWTLKGRDMRDEDGDYKLFFDQRPERPARCEGKGNILEVTLFDAEGWWHRSKGTREYPKGCVGRWHAWFTDSGGHVMYYKYVNRDEGWVNGPVRSRDA